MSFAKLIHELREGPNTAAVIAAHIGLHPQTVRDYVNAMHAEGEVHIAGYADEFKYRPPSPQWVLGPGDDMPRVAVKVASKERTARYRQRRNGQSTTTGAARRTVVVASTINKKPMNQ